MGAAVRVIDADLNIEYANDYMKKHFDRAVGRPCFDFLERSAPCEPCLVRQAITGGKIVAGEFCTPGERWFAYVAAPIKKPDGKISSVSVIRDITEAKRGQQQMIQQEKMSAIGLLASGIAHEINNPLGVISTFAQMLSKGGQTAEDIQKCADVINRNVENCGRIVQSLLSFSRLETAQKEAVDLNDCVRDAFILTSAAVRKAGIEITQEMAAQPLMIESDRVQMQQVFVNLIINAVQAMPEGGALCISTARDVSPSGVGTTIVRVSDTGCGMSPAVAARAMEPFFSTKKAQRGTGLGLSICKEIVEKHGGRITFTSQEGKGTEFIVALPELTRTAERADSVSSSANTSD
jgi:signal transduction histidine kinase